MPELTEDVTFRHEDWYGEELTDRHFVGCEFFDVDLTEAVSRGAVFTGCTFGNVAFNASRHVDSAFTRCVFGGATSSRPSSPAASWSAAPSASVTCVR